MATWDNFKREYKSLYREAKAEIETVATNLFNKHLRSHAREVTSLRKEVEQLKKRLEKLAATPTAKKGATKAAATAPRRKSAARKTTRPKSSGESGQDS